MEHLLWLNNFNKLHSFGLENVDVSKIKDFKGIKSFKVKKGNKYFRRTSLNIETINTPIHPDSIPLKDCILFIGNVDTPGHSQNKLNKVLDILKNNDCFNDYKYTLILIPTDKTIPKNEINDIPDNVKNIYLTNINYSHPIIKFLPLGIDQRNIDNLPLMNNNYNNNRSILCYCNFSLNTHEDRRTVYSMVKDKDFILKENMGTYQNYSISRETFFQRLNDSKFVICPRGAGLDTHRFYETLYCGAIPIVVREQFHDKFANLPILFLDTLEQFETLTEDFLEEKYLELYNKMEPYYKELDLVELVKEITTSLEQ